MLKLSSPFIKAQCASQFHFPIHTHTVTLIFTHSRGAMQGANHTPWSNEGFSALHKEPSKHKQLILEPNLRPSILCFELFLCSTHHENDVEFYCGTLFILYINYFDAVLVSHGWKSSVQKFFYLAVIKICFQMWKDAKLLKDELSEELRVSDKDWLSCNFPGVWF